MQGRLGRTSIVATLLCTLLIPAVGSLADSESKLDKIKHELGNVRERIEARETEAAPIEERVDALNSQMIALRDQLATLDARLTEVQAKVRSAQAQIDATQEKIDRIKDEAVAQAVSLYKAG